MCGIAGVLDSGRGTGSLDETVRSMTAALRHRGPDGAGIWVDVREGIALGHRRLSVVDLTDRGAQPMKSADERYVTVFNGEIYNFRALRRHLETLGYAFRSSSDTEVLLAAVCQWGVRGAVEEFNGMFAFAAWDRQTRTLYLARDRAGEKPLYYGRLGNAFVFGSEMSVLEAYPAGPGEIDEDAVAAYLRLGYVPAPYSIYSHVRKLPPGAIMAVGSDGREGEPVRYWGPEARAQPRMPDQRPVTREDAVEQLDALLSDAVRMQTYADVPVGAFLSGGVDSSTVVAMMCRHARLVRTFTIGFAEAEYDEAPHARRVAGHLGTSHAELEVTAADAMAVIPKLADVYGEPFADASQIPTYLVSQFARQHVKVALSGDGADELFGGYIRYTWANRAWNAMRPFPPTLRRLASRAIASVPPSWIDRMVPSKSPARPGDRLHKLAALFAARDEAELYLKLVSQWQEPAIILGRGMEPETGVAWRMRAFSERTLTERMMLVDLLTYLPDDILVKVDRASMAHGLETRSPFLDRRVIEFARSLPVSWKVRGGVRKWILRRVLERHVPRALVDRPKAGFAVPLHDWIRGPLRGWAEELLSERRLRADGVFQPETIRTRWSEHLSGTRNWVHALWAVLMFQAWRERRKTHAGPEFVCVARENARE